MSDSPSRGRFRRWAYRQAEGSRRDLRLDLLRGYAVFAMVVDHFGGTSWLTPLTGNNQFLVSAAEGFVFMSGFVMGLVYGGRVRQVGWVAAADAMLRRAAVLYAVTVGLTLLFVGLFWFTDLRLWFDRAYGLGLTDPVELVVGTLTLHYTYHGTDILWMYTVLISAAPLFFLLLATNRTPLLLAGSFLLWLAYQVFPAQAAVPWVAGNAVNFPVAAWQIYFVVGIALGYHRRWLIERLAPLPKWPLFGLCVLGMLVLMLLDWGHDSGRIAAWPLVKGLAGQTYQAVFDKPSVAWGRLVAFAIATGYFFLLVTLFWRPIYRALGWLLVPLGQASLLAYGLHLIVIVAVYNLDVWGFYDRSRWANTWLQALTVLLVWGLVQVWDHLGALPVRVQRLFEAPVPLPAARRRVILATSALLVGLTAGTALWVGPVRAVRQARLQATSAAGTLTYVPDTAAEPMTRILLVLHDDSTTGPETAIPLVDQARQAGWTVIAPTVDYGDWASQDDVRAAAARVLPDLQALVDDLDEHIQRPTRARAMVYGEGRGGQLALMYALFYPEYVRGVASANAIPCTLPLEAVGRPGDEAPLPFPAGVGDLAEYRGQPIDYEALSRISFRLQPRAGQVGGGLEACDWLEPPPDPDAQVAQFRALLAGLGAEIELVPDPAGTQAQPLALRFLESLPAQP